MYVITGRNGGHGERGGVPANGQDGLLAIAPPAARRGRDTLVPIMSPRLHSQGMRYPKPVGPTISSRHTLVHTYIGTSTSGCGLFGSDATAGGVAAFVGTGNAAAPLFGDFLSASNFARFVVRVSDTIGHRYLQFHQDLFCTRVSTAFKLHVITQIPSHIGSLSERATKTLMRRCQTIGGAPPPSSHTLRDGSSD